MSDQPQDQEPTPGIPPALPEPSEAQRQLEDNLAAALEAIGRMAKPKRPPKGDKCDSGLYALFGTPS